MHQLGPVFIVLQVGQKLTGYHFHSASWTDVFNTKYLLFGSYKCAYSVVMRGDVKADQNVCFYQLCSDVSPVH